MNPQLKHPKSTLGAPLHSGSLLLCLLLHHRRQVEAEGLRAKIQRHLLVFAARPRQR